MKLSNKLIVNSINTLSILTGLQLPIKASYGVAKNISKIEKELTIYNAEKQKLIDKYSIKDKEGKTKVNENGMIDIAPENVEAWNKDIEELLAIENEVDIHLIDLSVFDNCNAEIAPGELMNVEYMFK